MEDDGEEDMAHDRGRWKKPNHSVETTLREEDVGDLNEYVLFPGFSSPSPRG